LSEFRTKIDGVISAVIFDPAAAPTLEEYLEAVAGQPLDEQESLLKDPVTMEWLKEPCYTGCNSFCPPADTLVCSASLPSSILGSYPPVIKKMMRTKRSLVEVANINESDN
jgi:hypothetical protein